MSLLGVFWISFLATVSNVKNPENFLWFFVLVLGWAGIGAATFFIQKKYFPENYLVSASEGKSKRKVYDYALSVGLGGIFRRVD